MPHECGTPKPCQSAQTASSERAHNIYISHNKSRLPTIKWKILHANIVNNGERKYVEAFEIQKHSGDLMNGCTGRIISVRIFFNLLTLYITFKLRDNKQLHHVLHVFTY